MKDIKTPATPELQELMLDIIRQESALFEEEGDIGARLSAIFQGDLVDSESFGARLSGIFQGDLVESETFEGPGYLFEIYVLEPSPIALLYPEWIMSQFHKLSGMEESYQTIRHLDAIIIYVSHEEQL
jgi:hypothetical protein